MIDSVIESPSNEPCSTVTLLTFPQSTMLLRMPGSRCDGSAGMGPKASIDSTAASRRNARTGRGATAVPLSGTATIACVGAGGDGVGSTTVALATATVVDFFRVATGLVAVGA